MDKIKAVTLALLCAFLITTGQVLWKVAIDKNGGFISKDKSIIDNLSGYIISPYMMGGVAIYILATIFWMYLLGKYEYSYIYPMMAITYIISIAYAAAIFKESIGYEKIVGVILIVAGVFFVSMSNHN
jgi:drug/metabolite transporter (DMT)-like permease